MKIYNYLGVELLDIQVDDKSYRYKELMSDNQLFLYFSLPYFIELPLGSYVDFKAERYYLSDPENFKMNHTRDWEYTLVLDSYIALTKTTKFKFFTLVGGLVEGDFELKFSLIETAAEFAALFVNNMNNADPDRGWEVGDCIESEPILLDFNHTFCYDVLSELADKFKTEWEIEGKTLHIRKVEKLKESPTPLTYGYDSGLIPGFQRSNAGKKKANRLYIETSERNIDSATYGRKTLSMLKSASVVYNGITYVTDASGSYIERQNRTGLILENSVDLTHIYPKRVGTVSSVIAVNADKNLYDVVDLSIENELNFNDYLIAGETMTLIFQTGELAGLEFDVKYIHADRRFELVPISETGITYPADTLLPAIGDKYAVFHCALPNTYITSAETEATNEAAAELYEQEQEKYTYNGTLDELYAKRHWLEIGGFLNVGYFVRLTLQDAITEPVDIRIVGVKDYVNKPQKPELTLSNEASGTQLGSALASVKNKEQAVTRLNNDTTRFARRGFREAMETAAMLQNSLLNFSGSINPVTVQAMQYVAGDESLQFDFVADSTSKTPVSHIESYDPGTKKFTSAAGVLMHKTLGIDTVSSSHQASEYKSWTMAAYLSPVLDDASKSYYVYAKVSKTANTGVFLLSETAIAMEQTAGYYHLLMGLLNSEFDGDRSYSPMYGYSEWTPGRFTIKKIVSPSGGVYFDLEKNNGEGEIGGKIKFVSTNGTLKDVQTGLTEAQTAAQAAAALDATNKAVTAQTNAINAALEYGAGKNLFPLAEFQNGWGGFTFFDKPVYGSCNLDPTWSLGGNMNLSNNQGLNTTFLVHDSNNAILESEISTAVPAKYNCTGSAKYIASVYAATHRCNAQIVILWFDTNKSYISHNLQDTGFVSARTDVKSGGRELNGYKRLYIAATAPANACYYEFHIRKYGNYAGETNSYAFFCRPAFEQVDARTTKPGPWSPFASSADIAAAKAAAAAAQATAQGAATTANAITNNLTTIDGGLILTTLIKMLNGTAESAGMAAKTTGNDIAFWGGGTLEQAIQRLTAFGVTHSGDAWFKGVIEALSGKIGLFDILAGNIVGRDVDGIEKVRFGVENVPELSELSGNSVVIATLENSMSYGEAYYAGGSTIVQGGVVTRTLFFYIPYSTTATVTGTAVSRTWVDTLETTIINNESLTYNIKILKPDGSVLVANYTQGNSFTCTVIGAYSVVITATLSVALDSLSDTAMFELNVGGSTVNMIESVQKTAIGKNGFYSYFSLLEHIFFKAGVGFIGRGRFDIPAGLGGANVSSAGGGGGLWGRVTGVSKASSTVTITHTIGDTAYAIMVMPQSTATWYWQAKTNTTIQVITTGAFDFVLIRTK